MAESGPVPGKGTFRASILKTVLTSTGKGLNECENQKIVESGRVPGKRRILASTEKLYRQAPEKGGISVSTEKWLNQCQYQKM